MENAAELNMPISLHEEDKSFIANNGINAGPVADSLGITGSPAIAEEVMVARDGMLALHTKAPVVIQHISSGNSVALVRLAKELGADIHAEATPHHFTLTDGSSYLWYSCKNESASAYRKVLAGDHCRPERRNH